MAGPRKHHYIPRWVLRAHGNEGKVFQLERRTGKIIGPTAVENVAALRDFYAVRDAGATEPRDAVEAWLSKIEGGAKEPIERLVHEPRSISRIDYFSIAQFVAAAYCRTPAARERIRQMLLAAGRLHLDSYANNPPPSDLARRGADHFERLREGVTRGSPQLVPSEDTITSAMSAQAIELAFVVAQMRWTVLRSDVPFVLGDCYTTMFDPEPMMGGNALLSSLQAETVVPLTANAVLVLTPTPAAMSFEAGDAIAECQDADDPRLVLDLIATLPLLKVREERASRKRMRSLSYRAYAQSDRWVISGDRELLRDLHASSICNFREVARHVLEPPALFVTRNEGGAQRIVGRAAVKSGGLASGKPVGFEYASPFAGVT